MRYDKRATIWDPLKYGKERSKQGIPQKNGVIIHDAEGKYFHESTVCSANLEAQHPFCGSKHQFEDCYANLFISSTRITMAVLAIKRSPMMTDKLA
jgi:hypothetical protein